MKIRTKGRNVLQLALCIFLCTTFAQMLAVAVTQADIEANAKSCRELAGIAHEDWTVSSVTWLVPPFPMPDPGLERPVERQVDVPICRVIGQAQPTPQSSIRFEVWLPVAREWNGRVLGVGTGNLLGAINYRGLAFGVNRRYAAVATDNGHVSKSRRDASWALGAPEKIVDFGHRAQHRVTAAAKFILERHYGRRPERAIFVGCSQGGNKALMEAQRYPGDYDGIIAGAPVYSFSREFVFQAAAAIAVAKVAPTGIPASKVQLLSGAIQKRCGGPGGVVENPEGCKFDPAELICRNGAQGGCLTQKEVDAIRVLYAGPRDQGGRQIFPGLSPGSERDWGLLWTDVPPERPPGGSWAEFFRYMVFHDPSFDPMKIDVVRDGARAIEKLGPIIDADQPDLSGFHRRGGKLIIFHGWSDAFVPPLSSLNYYRSVVSTMGQNTTDEFLRLFMVPGLAHCQGGPGPDAFGQPYLFETPASGDHEQDVLTAMERWMDKGEAPSSIVASKMDGRKVVSTRRVRAYRQ